MELDKETMAKVKYIQGKHDNESARQSIRRAISWLAYLEKAMEEDDKIYLSNDGGSRLRELIAEDE